MGVIPPLLAVLPTVTVTAAAMVIASMVVATTTWIAAQAVPPHGP
jgi:hypothetical protein